jgi:hypothetical protein
MVEGEGSWRRRWEFYAMNEEAVYQEDLTYEVSDEALETAAATNEAQPAWTNLCTGIQCPG